MQGQFLCVAAGARRPLRVLLVLLLALGVTLPAAAQEITTASRDSRERILIDGELFCDLVYGDESPYGEIPRPIIYPIIGPTGAEMTRHYPMRHDVEGEEHDHPHHRSLWFAHFVNGIDFWTQGEGRGRIVVDGGDGWSVDDDGYCSVHFRTSWIGPDGDRVLDAGQVYGFTVLDDGSRAIDIEVELTPGVDAERVVLADTKEGTMAIRTHPALRLVGEHATGHALNSEGEADRDLWGKRAAWVAYWGTIDGEVCGVAIFDHPDNLRHPTWWHARDYGLIAANPFGAHDFEGAEPGTGDYTLEWGETLTLQYRFVFFAGDAEEADIAGKYAQWVEETTEGEAEGDASGE
ncbi:MAG: PmoA family protein [Phycisphaerales bacterium JB063]